MPNVGVCGKALAVQQDDNLSSHDRCERQSSLAPSGKLDWLIKGFDATVGTSLVCVENSRPKLFALRLDDLLRRMTEIRTLFILASASLESKPHDQHRRASCAD